MTPEQHGQVCGGLETGNDHGALRMERLDGLPDGVERRRTKSERYMEEELCDRLFPAGRGRVPIGLNPLRVQEAASWNLDRQRGSQFLGIRFHIMIGHLEGVMGLVYSDVLRRRLGKSTAMSLPIGLISENHSSEIAL